MSIPTGQSIDPRQPGKTGILLVNLGTPDKPTATALRRYLAEFLWDPRVVEIPRLLWWLILHTVILPLRPARSAKAYREIWLEDGSPLLVYSKKQAEALQAQLRNDSILQQIEVELAMRYGQPSIRQGLLALRGAGVTRLLVLPLYPQYSATTTASVFDAISDELRTWRRLPELRFINDYHDFPLYINAMAAHIRRFWADQGEPEKLILSFHGIPKRCVLKGDPYYDQCQATARLLVQTLGLSDEQWLIAFQSRFGREEWLKPYLDETLCALPGQACKRVDIFCPGFSADCLETLEEIAIQSQAVFMQAGGEIFRYIPALNDQVEHMEALTGLLRLHLGSWLIGQEPKATQDQCQAQAMQKGATV